MAEAAAAPAKKTRTGCKDKAPPHDNIIDVGFALLISRENIVRSRPLSLFSEVFLRSFEKFAEVKN